MDTKGLSVSDRLRGSLVALVTPFRHGVVDMPALEILVERQIAAGTRGIVAIGTTGEAPTLAAHEAAEVIGACVRVARGRVPVIAGIGENDTALAVSTSLTAAEMGADALLVVTGFYNKPAQTGLAAHFMTVAEAADLPVIVYNIPGRTASDVQVPTLAQLARHPLIVAVKDATGLLGRVAQQRLACGPDFIQLSGEDMTAVGFNAMGGVGCISVTANVAPAVCAAMQEATLAGRWAEALALQDRLAPLHDALFLDPSPAPVKYALARLGLIAEELRLPMVPASERAKLAVDRALEGLGLI